MTIIALPSPEPKATIIGFTPSGEPIWSIIPMHRLRDRKAGWMEVPADMPREDIVRAALSQHKES